MSQSYNAILVNKILSDFTKGNKIQSLNNLSQYLKDNPKDLTARYNYGYMCQQCNKIDIAKKSYLKVISKDPKHWRSKFNIYTIYIAEKSYSLALKYIDEASSLSSARLRLGDHPDSCRLLVLHPPGLLTEL